MSAVKELSDVLKAASTATSVLGLSTLLVNSLGELSGIPAEKLVMTRSLVINLDECMDTGIYFLNLNSTSMNPPVITAWNEGSIMEVLAVSGECWQRITTRQMEVVMRFYNRYSGWKDWKKVSLISI